MYMKRLIEEIKMQDLFVVATIFVIEHKWKFIIGAVALIALVVAI